MRILSTVVQPNVHKNINLKCHNNCYKMPAWFTIIMELKFCTSAALTSIYFRNIQLISYFNYQWSHMKSPVISIVFPQVSSEFHPSPPYQPGLTRFPRKDGVGPNVPSMFLHDLASWCAVCAYYYRQMSRKRFIQCLVSKNYFLPAHPKPQIFITRSFMYFSQNRRWMPKCLDRVCWRKDLEQRHHYYPSAQRKLQLSITEQPRMRGWVDG